MANFLTMYRRNITQTLLEAMADTSVVLLHGARQTGKTTLVQTLAKEDFPARYLTLDDAGILAAARRDPAGFLAGLDDPVILDEVQRAPDLFLAIKAAVDRDRKPGRFLLTGSANVLTVPSLSESLAGRMEIHTLWTLSQGELGGRREGFIDAMFGESMPPFSRSGLSKRELLDRLVRGGYPEVQARASEIRREAWFGAYITTILQRDVRDLANIEALTELPRMLRLLSARVMTLMNFSELSRSLALPLTTLRRYLSLLQMTFLVQLLPAWSASLRKRLVKAPKILVCDSGLATYLAGADTRRVGEDPNLLGPHLENFVAMELLKQASWSRTQAQIYHFRTRTGQEVDFVLEDRSGRVVGIEVKAAATLGDKDFKGLRFLEESTKRRFRRGVVLYTGSEAIPFTSNLHALPVDALWNTGAGPQRRKPGAD